MGGKLIGRYQLLPGKKGNTIEYVLIIHEVEDYVAWKIIFADLRDKERDKIVCGKKHFEAIGALLR
ncbi:MAG: hypothetical protein V3V31_04245 [Methylococcales bacterium]